MRWNSTITDHLFLLLFKYTVPIPLFLGRGFSPRHQIFPSLSPSTISQASVLALIAILLSLWLLSAICSQASVCRSSSPVPSVLTLPSFLPQLSQPFFFLPSVTPAIKITTVSPLLTETPQLHLTASLLLININLHSSLQFICNYTETSIPSSPNHPSLQSTENPIHQSLQLTRIKQAKLLTSPRSLPPLFFCRFGSFKPRRRALAAELLSARCPLLAKTIAAPLLFDHHLRRRRHRSKSAPPSCCPSPASPSSSPCSSLSRPICQAAVRNRNAASPNVSLHLQITAAAFNPPAIPFSSRRAQKISPPPLSASAVSGDVEPVPPFSPQHRRRAGSLSHQSSPQSHRRPTAVVVPGRSLTAALSNRLCVHCSENDERMRETKKIKKRKD